MKHSKYFGFAVLAVLILGISVSRFNDKTTRVHAGDDNTVTQDTTVFQSRQQAFALKTFRVTADGTPNKNLVISPLGISVTLDALILGSKAKTRTQLEEATELCDYETKWFISAIQRNHVLASLPELNMAGGIWIQKDYKIQSAYLEQLLKLTKQDIQNVDFSEAGTADKINSWIDKNTDQKVKKLITSVSPETRLILLNTLVFDGKWKNAFDSARTAKGYFTSFDGKEIRIPFMQQENEFSYFKGEHFQMLEMPYEGDRISMFVILPEKKEDFADFTKSLTADKFQQWQKKSQKSKLDVRFPVFTFENKLDLMPVLKTMGIEHMFTDSADFSLITEGQTLKVSQFLQGVYLKVNEKGTQAAAATEATLTLKSMPAKRAPTFYADRPFIYLILDNKSRSILFMGQIVNPSEIESGGESATVESPAKPSIPQKPQKTVKKEVNTSINNSGIGGELK